MSIFGKKGKEASPDNEGAVSFIEWAVGQDFFSDAVHPGQRTQKLITEIQRRTLAEQVLIASSHLDTDTLEILFSAPITESSVLPPDLIRLMLERAFTENRILDLSEFGDIDPVTQFFQEKQLPSVLIVPLNIHEKTIEALIVLNYFTGQNDQIHDFIQFVASLLTLSLQNVLLHSLLQNKDEEVTDWSEQVGERIGADTRRFLTKEFQYYNLFEEAPHGIVVHDINGFILEANQSARQMLGYDKKGIAQRKWFDLVTDDWGVRLETFFADILRAQKAEKIEVQIRKNSGELFWAELCSQRVRVHGKVALETYIRDISLQKVHESQLRETKTKYEVFVESSLVGAFVIQDGVIHFTNEKFEELCGIPKNELLGKDFFSLIAPEDRSMVTSRERRREEGEDVLDHYEIRLLKREEHWWGEVRCCRIELEDKPAILGNVVDITQRKRLELQLLETQKMESIGTLAGGIAHDFNNLLGGILGYASLLLSDMPKDHIYYEDIHTIAETAKQAADLTNRLLAFARGGKYQVTAVDCNRTLDDVVAILSRTVDRSISIETHLVKNLWTIKGDSQQVHQAVLNICLNAIDAMPGGGKLVLSTANVILDDAFVQTQMGVNAGDYVRVTISDSGIGMDEKTKSRIFEPFFTTKPAVAAKGLGLAMVYGIVKNHEGAILVDSILGSGTKFTIYFPKYTDENRLPDESDTAKLSKKKDTVLLVDDEAVIRRVATRMLEKGGFNVIVAKDGYEAAAIFKEQKTDIQVVLMDLIMPGLNGTETVEKLREIDPDVKIIFTSGYGVEDHPELQANKKGTFIQKPFQTEVLIEKVQEFLS